MANTRELDALRKQIAALKARLRELDFMPLAPGELAEHIEVELSELSERFQERNSLGVELANAERIELSGGEVLGFLAFAFPDRLREVFDTLARPYATGSVPTSQRDALRGKLEAELYRLEVEEERAICALEAQGDTIPRRLDADPSIVLGNA